MIEPRPDPVRLQPRTPAADVGALLYAVRRIASGGLHDAFAANAMLGAFGIGFRRPLVLLRAVMAELARVSTRTIPVAPCCCPRMTDAEGEMVAAIALAARDPGAAHSRFARLAGVNDCPAVLSSAAALAQAFADLGRPLAVPECEP